LNPAIALGLEFVMYFGTDDAKYLRRSYVYIIGPIVGGILAGYFFRHWWLPRKIS